MSLEWKKEYRKKHGKEAVKLKVMLLRAMQTLKEFGMDNEEYVSVEICRWWKTNQPKRHPTEDEE